MINNTNLEFFNSKQKAELFRLKGVFLTSLGAKQEANHAYSHAVQVCMYLLEAILVVLLWWLLPTKTVKSTKGTPFELLFDFILPPSPPQECSISRYLVFASALFFLPSQKCFMPGFCARAHRAGDVKRRSHP